jgi:sugar/nucleoside kinase (ribokinase family)
LSIEDLAAIPLVAADAVYLSGYELCYPVSGAALEHWLPMLDADVWLILDPGPLAAEIAPERLLRALARTTIFTSNAREAYLLTGRENAAEAAVELKSRIAPGGWVIVRVGPQGCWIVGSSRVPHHVPGRAAEAIDTTGAGDAHTAALLASLACGDDILAAARVANVAASLSTQRRGPATGPTAVELSEALHEL